MPASNNIFKNIRYFEKGGETTPFLFKGKEYYLLNKFGNSVTFVYLWRKDLHEKPNLIKTKR